MRTLNCRPTHQLQSHKSPAWCAARARTRPTKAMRCWSVSGARSHGICSAWASVASPTASGTARAALRLSSTAASQGRSRLVVPARSAAPTAQRRRRVPMARRRPSQRRPSSSWRSTAQRARQASALPSLVERLFRALVANLSSNKTVSLSCSLPWTAPVSSPLNVLCNQCTVLLALPFCFLHARTPWKAESRKARLAGAAHERTNGRCRGRRRRTGGGAARGVVRDRRG